MRALPACLVLLAGCTFTFQRSTSWSTRSELGLVGKTATVSACVECPSDTAPLEMELATKCSRGRLAFELLAPDGRCVMRDTVRHGERECALKLPGREGTWRCRIELEGFDGDYSVRLASHEGMTLRVQIAAEDAPASAPHKR